MGYLKELRARARRYRRYGLLPDSRVATVHTHRGSSLQCVICGEPILATEPEIVIEGEFDAELVDEMPLYRLHHLCHVIWMTEARPIQTRV